MIRKRVLFLCVLLVSGAAWSQLPREDLPKLPQAEVVRIVDGDTVVLRAGEQDITCRLIGVDTPETVHPSQPVEDYGKEASAFLDNLLKGEKVWVEQEQGNTQDRYGRALVYLYRMPDGMFVNLEIVRQGYGHSYKEYPHKYMADFNAYETKARQTGKGLWGLQGETPESSSIPQVQSPQFPPPSANTAPSVTPTQSYAPPQAAATARPQVSGTFYATRTGSKYHRAGCRYLSRSQIPMSRQDAINRGLGACSVCRP